jgi:HlyD family secretion protein
VQRGSIEEYVEETGVIKTDENMRIYSEITGKVEALFIETGDIAKAGQILAEVNSEDLNLQIKELQKQKEEVTAQYYEAIKPTDREEISKLEVQLRAAEVDVEEAQRAFENSKKLYEEGTISFDAYKKAEVDVKREESNLESIKLELEGAQKQASKYLKKQYQAQIQQIQIKIDRLNKQKEDLSIIAPIDGTILSQNIEKGMYIQQGMELVEIGDINKIYIESAVLVGEIADVKKGLKVTIENDDLGIGVLTGIVRKIHPKAFSKVSDLGIEQKRVLVEINIEQNSPKLKPNYDVDIKIITNSKKDVLMIPDHAVFEYKGEYYVFVNQEGTAVVRKIIKGIESDGKVEVKEGLKEGEEVIVSPSDEMEEGMKLITK